MNQFDFLIDNKEEEEEEGNNNNKSYLKYRKSNNKLKREEGYLDTDRNIKKKKIKGEISIKQECKKHFTTLCVMGTFIFYFILIIWSIIYFTS